METDVEQATKSERRKLFLERFHAADFQDVLASVISRTKSKMNGMRWMQVISGPTPSGREATDIVHEVIVKAVQNNDETGPSGEEPLEEWLWDRASSSVSNFVRSYENKRRKRVHEAGQDPVYEDGKGTLEDSRTPADAAIDSDLAALAGELVPLFADFIKDDAKLGSLLECLGAGITKREEIAQYLEVTPNEVTNLRKKMARRVEEFSARHRDKNPFKD